MSKRPIPIILDMLHVSFYRFQMLHPLQYREDKSSWFVGNKKIQNSSVSEITPHVMENVKTIVWPQDDITKNKMKVPVINLPVTYFSPGLSHDIYQLL